jgi:hypothetical protein
MSEDSDKVLFELDEEEKIRRIRAKRAEYARTYYHKHKTTTRNPGRPSKTLTEEELEERAAKKRDAGRQRYEKNREQLLQHASDYYKEKIGGDYKYRSKNSGLTLTAK